MPQAGIGSSEKLSVAGYGPGFPESVRFGELSQKIGGFVGHQRGKPFGCHRSVLASVPVPPPPLSSSLSLSHTLSPLSVHSLSLSGLSHTRSDYSLPIYLLATPLLTDSMNI